jgi:ATP phosphoribosyltransferase regulatory subunit HisZ
VRRAGFDADRAALAAAFAALDDTLARAALEIGRFRDAVGRAGRRRPLAAAFEADRERFAAALTAAYASEAPREDRSRHAV